MSQLHTAGSETKCLILPGVIIGCTASKNQLGYFCNEAFDGITNDDSNGWAIASEFPAWAIFELAQKTNINSLTLINGGHTYNNNRLITFKVTFLVEDKWVIPASLDVKEASDAFIDSDGTITLKSGLPVLSLNFNLVSSVKSIKIDVTKTDSDNLVLQEIIPKLESPFWFGAVLDGNTVYTVAGDKLSNLDEFFRHFNDTLGVKPSSESILALDPNKKYCARAWLSANASGNQNGGNKQNQLFFQLN